MKTTRCTRCSAEFSDEELRGHMSCPTCGTEGTPCDIADDVTIKINWHELRILSIWATNFAATLQKASSKEVLCNIISRLEAQYPARTRLTLLGEVAQLREQGYNIELVSDDEIEEQVFVAPKPFLM